MSTKDKCAVWLGDSTNQMWKVDEANESFANGYLRQCLTALAVWTAFLPHFRFKICAQTPGGTLADFNSSLEQIFGEGALEIENNPELANVHVTTCHAGNGLEVHKEEGRG